VCSGEHLAVKRIYIQEELEQGNDVSSLSIQRVLSRQQIERETSILAELVHPNIVQYIGCGRRISPSCVCVRISIDAFLNIMPLACMLRMEQRIECDGPTAHIFMEYIHAGSLSKYRPHASSFSLSRFLLFH
jgi:serine/threonine protein kinase